MLKKNNYYKSNDILNENFINRMDSYFNPYEYNFESNKKNENNTDLMALKSKSHIQRKVTKK